jgi:hypothetical protein
MIEPENVTGVAARVTHGTLAQANPRVSQTTVLCVLFTIRDAHPSRPNGSAGNAVL